MKINTVLEAIYFKTVKTLNWIWVCFPHGSKLFNAIVLRLMKTNTGQFSIITVNNYLLKKRKTLFTCTKNTMSGLVHKSM